MKTIEDKLYTQKIVQALPLLPVLGFVFALSYELAFFYFLGIDIELVVQIQDIIRSSALNIAPAIPLFVFGALNAMADRKERNNRLPNPERGRLRAFYESSPGNVIVFTVWAAAILYVTLGTAPELSVYPVFLVGLLMVGRLFLFEFLAELDYETFLSVWLIITACSIFASMGTSEAFSVRSGRLSQYPLLVPEERLVVNEATPVVLRRFSSGLLISRRDPDSVELINDNSEPIVFSINPEPFRGVLCYVFDWCWASGWHFQRNDQTQQRSE